MSNPFNTSLHELVAGPWRMMPARHRTAAVVAYMRYSEWANAAAEELANNSALIERANAVLDAFANERNHSSPYPPISRSTKDKMEAFFDEWLAALMEPLRLEENDLVAETRTLYEAARGE